jgi:hypothetical protein
MHRQKILATVGPPLSGKTTFCGNLPQFTPRSFATPLYDMLSIVVGKDKVREARRLNQKGEPLAELCGKSLRQALQTLGTEWGRELIGEDVWVDLLLRSSRWLEYIAVDDLRFPNEYDALLRRGAVFVRLLPYAELRNNGWEGHSSESYWRTFKVHKEVRWNTHEEIRLAAQSFGDEWGQYVGTEPRL